MPAHAQPENQSTTTGQTLLEVGHVMTSPTRIVTYGDVADFAQLTNDVNPIHLDPRAAAKSIFKRPVAHGQLIQSLASGMVYQLGLVKDTVVFTSIAVEFKRAVYLMEAIRVRVTVMDITPQRRPAGSKQVTLRVEILKQERGRDRIAQECVWKALVTPAGE